MTCRNTRKLSLIFLFSLLLIFSLIVGPVQRGAAAPAGQSTGQLDVEGALLDLPAVPGMVYVHHMKISTGAQAPAMDVTIQAMGLGQALDGSFQAIPPDQDTDPFSARTYITAINTTAFHLNPGDSVPVDVTITIPVDLGGDTRYAAIYVKGTPAGSASVTEVLATIVPIVITPQGKQFSLTGKITDLSVDPLEPGKPIVVKTTIKNTGNRHFKIKEDVKISDSSGGLVADLTVPVTGNSIIPPYSHLLSASYSALDRPNGLAPGTYTVVANVTHEDGSLVDTAQTTFVVKTSLQACPGVDPEHMLVTSFSDQEPGKVDARPQTNVQVAFENTGKVTGQVAICAYSQEPAGSPRFSDSIDAGGTGANPVRFFLIRVDGFNQGVAHLAVSYQLPELNGMDPNSLFLASPQGGSWNKLENLLVQSGPQLVIGDVPVDILVNGPLFALGGGTAAASAGTTPQANFLGGLSLPVVIGGTIFCLGLLLLLVLIFLVFQRRRKEDKD